MSEPESADPASLADPRPDPQPSADERATLTEFLDWYRLTLVLKASGLTDEQARTRFVPSKTTIMGLVRHSAEVERHWFQRMFLGHDADDVYRRGVGVAENPDLDWDGIDDASIADAIADYEAECEKARAITAAAHLDALSVRRARGYGDRSVSLRWILVHMIEETARHVGHADILRELTDGTTGD